MNKTLQIIANNIPNIPNFPKKGIQFKDLTKILLKPEVWNSVTQNIIKIAKKMKFDVILAPEARGFWFAIPVANALHKPFIPARKTGKLPRPTIKVMNRIEYGTVKFEVHKQDIKPRSRVLIIDDLLATGGTIVGLTELVRKLKAIVVGVITVVELPELNGIKILAKKNVPCTALIQLPGK